jgi:putative sugar O-methyltransferase
MQDDIGCPPYLFDYVNRNGYLLFNVLKFLKRKFLYYKSNLNLKNSISDDIAIIESLGGNDLLESNPVNRTPGSPAFAKFGKYYVNNRWMRYVYLAHRIEQKKMLPPGSTWIDIGSFYGGLQGIVYKLNFSTKIILIDFHHQLFRSFAYLHELFPDATHNLGIDAVLSDKSEGSFNYVHINDFYKLEALEIDLITNFFSLGEMSKEHFRSYLNSPVFAESKSIYTVNRFISAPFFEPTYDNKTTINDYIFPKHDLQYLDVFPIHHFNLLKRNFLGKKRFRNTSSSYFEGFWLKHK